MADGAVASHSPEQCGTDADHGGGFLDGHLGILRHAHREVREREAGAGAGLLGDGKEGGEGEKAGRRSQLVHNVVASCGTAGAVVKEAGR